MGCAPAFFMGPMQDLRLHRRPQNMQFFLSMLRRVVCRETQSRAGQGRAGPRRWRGIGGGAGEHPVRQQVKELHRAPPSSRTADRVVYARDPTPQDANPVRYLTVPVCHRAWLRCRAQTGSCLVSRPPSAVVAALLSAPSPTSTFLPASFIVLRPAFDPTRADRARIPGTLCGYDIDFQFSLSVDVAAHR
ncbi:hypothetical protein VTN00DRAFT_4833 [Thermoascus crustaceus]|uniref:uncharacterized protein n=1 Tax=Thermoascus crustaceus TaxID=5088 RepID=UPI0037420079